MYYIVHVQVAELDTHYTAYNELVNVKPNNNNNNNDNNNNNNNNNNYLQDAWHLLQV